MSLTERVRWWAKLGIENPKVSLSILTFLVSFLGIGYDAYDSREVIAVKDYQMDALSKHIYDVSLKDKPSKVSRKTIVIREGCKQCMKQIEELKRIYHPE